MYLEMYGLVIIFYIDWEGGESYRGLNIGVDLMLSLEYFLLKFLVYLVKFLLEVDVIF